MSSARARALKRGSKIGRDLTVIGMVGEGGGGDVFIVWNHRAWCPMACKVFGSARRARGEAKTLAALDHPNVVRFLGLGRPAHMLMEFLEGPTLLRLIRSSPRRRLSVPDAARAGIHLGSALTHIHERGFLHLDVKPSNAIVVGGRPVLFDFSTARPRTIKRLRHREGTDAYMAPEQCVSYKAVGILEIGPTAVKAAPHIGPRHVVGLPVSPGPRCAAARVAETAGGDRRSRSGNLQPSSVLNGQGKPDRSRCFRRQSQSGLWRDGPVPSGEGVQLQAPPVRAATVKDRRRSDRRSQNGLPRHL